MKTEENRMQGQWIIFSDIQGDAGRESANQTDEGTLKRFKDATKGMKRRGYISLGDVIHHGSKFSENRCVDFVRSEATYSIRGNHDVSNQETKITPQNIAYLESLPNRILLGNVLLFHSSLRNPGAYLRVDEELRAEQEHIAKNFPEVEFAFFGHTHQREFFGKERLTKLLSGKEQSLKGLERPVLINPGGLCMESDHKKRSFAWVDFDSQKIKFFNIAEAEKMAYIAGVVNAWESRYMPALNLDSAGTFEGYVTNDFPHLMRNGQTNQTLSDFASALGTFDIKQAHKKPYIASYSLKLAQKLNALRLQVLDTYQTSDPFEVRNRFRQI